MIRYNNDKQNKTKTNNDINQGKNNNSNGDKNNNYCETMTKIN